MPFVFQYQPYAQGGAQEKGSPEKAQKELSSKIEKILLEKDFAALRMIFGKADEAYSLGKSGTLKVFAGYLAGFGDKPFQIAFIVAPKYGDTTESRRALVSLAAKQLALLQDRLKDEFPHLNLSLQINRAPSGSGMFGDVVKGGVQYVKKKGWINVSRKPLSEQIQAAIGEKTSSDAASGVLAAVPKKNGAEGGLSFAQKQELAESRASLVQECEEAGRRRNWRKYHTLNAEIEVLDLASSGMGAQALLEKYRKLAEAAQNGEYRFTKYPVYAREYESLKSMIEKRQAEKKAAPKFVFTPFEKEWEAQRKSVFSKMSTDVRVKAVPLPAHDKKIVLAGSGSPVREHALRQAPSKAEQVPPPSVSGMQRPAKQGISIVSATAPDRPAKINAPKPPTFEQLARKYYDKMGCGTIALGFEISTRKAIVSYKKDGTPRYKDKPVYTPVKGIDFGAFCEAFKAYVNSTTGKLDDGRFKSGKFEVEKGKFLLVDFSKPSNLRRLYVLDFENMKVIAALYGAHGKGSGNLTVEKVSNEPGSRASSAGLFRLERYSGSKFNRSIAMDMNGFGFNENSDRRGLLVHVFRGPFPRGSENYYSRLPRSWGCVATNRADYKKFIRSLPFGTGMYIHVDVGELARTSEKIKQKITNSDAVQKPTMQNIGKTLGDLGLAND